MSYTFMLLILVVLTVGLAVQQGAFSVDEFNEKINWTDVNVSVPSQPHLQDAINSMANGLGSALFSVMKWAAVWSAENPTIPFQLLIWCVLLAIFAPIFIVLFKLLIIIFLLIKEYFQGKTERKLMKKYKEVN